MSKVLFSFFWAGSVTLALPTFDLWAVAFATLAALTLADSFARLMAERDARRTA